MVAALNRPEIRLFRILIASRPERRLETSIGLEPTVEPVAIADAEKWSCAEIVRCISSRNCGPDADGYIVAVKTFLRICGRRDRKNKTGGEDYFDCHDRSLRLNLPAEHTAHSPIFDLLSS